ncbi:MAG TPA: acyl-CoA dehydrogenase [Cyanobacteria bacterium UBA11159]|nr:acyl-CoA dehydrogenase [Cyanobacteria bacterium UBA11367]HBE59172.1 acyl-CoA dehydrogenase [Cyanobacteria bacterium UBA11366]HBK64166.1 acyl-CoA dehydrogenase [Cyanobacteria bacterium UBA11166]HBR72543.1 acyl-CoA dehydrogenase [Cyanobacteria bacterium UBA11159]HBS69470.1 acyl-CoA dehydrogenase [Cyanobacteria bacterium UBA11153]HCA97890.1 acyl-CoA dehydrogenase [Cyanobacteria bacterium UBA9226]
MELNFQQSDSILDITGSYLREFVAPVASEIDTNPEALQEAIKGMCDYNLLALQLPKIWGGAEVSELTYRQFQTLVARYSGALAFLQTQHQSAAGFIINSENEYLKEKYLPYMGNGKILVGVGFSQLRRRGNPLLKAIPISGGYQLIGTIPWVTGYGFFQDFIIGATLPDSKEIYGIIPFTQTSSLVVSASAPSSQTKTLVVSASAPSPQITQIKFSQPMELAAMASTNTVTATLTNYFLPESQVIGIRKAGSIHENDKKNILNHSFLALGCARAGLDIIKSAAKQKQLNFINSAFDCLQAELNRCESDTIHALSPELRSWEERLKLRSWAINLAQRCANAAVTVSSGAANYQYHPAQRVSREALMFTVAGQTTDVMAATLKLLCIARD